jgi:membrane protein
MPPTGVGEPVVRAKAPSSAQSEAEQDAPRASSSSDEAEALHRADVEDEDERSTSAAHTTVHGARILRSILARLAPSLPEYHPTRSRRAYLLAVYVVRRWIVEDRCGAKAAVLTIHTLLSTVPIIGLALLVVGLMDETRGALLLHDMFRSFVPDTARAGELARSTMELAANVTFARLGPWGFLVTLVIAFALFATLERTFNRIWRVTRRRNVLVKFTMFYTLATLGPLLMLFSLAQPLFAEIGTTIGVPIVTSTLALVLLNRYLPFTEVGWRGAAIGGVLSAVLLELAKWGFGLYATRFALATYEGLYGSLAMLPILIIWSFMSWMMILLGAEVAYIVDQRHAIAHMGYVNRYLHERHEIGRPSGRTAARLLLAICDHYARRKLGTTHEELGDRFRLGLDMVNQLVSHLERAGYVIELDRPHALLIPALPLEQIRLAEVLDAFEQDKARHPRDDHLGELFDQLDGSREEIVGDLTYQDLVGRPRR